MFTVFQGVNPILLEPFYYRKGKWFEHFVSVLCYGTVNTLEIVSFSVLFCSMRSKGMGQDLKVTPPSISS